MPMLALALLLAPCAALDPPSDSLPPPTAAQLIRALEQYGQRRVATSEIRDISCRRVGDYANGATCEWQRMIDGSWGNYAGSLLFEDGAWILLETPPDDR